MVATATTPADIGLARPTLKRWHRAIHVVRQKPLGMVGLVLVLVIVVVAVSAPVSAPYDPNASGKSFLEANQGPSSQHWFGTDGHARDMYSRVVWGARLSLTVGFASMLIAITAGSLIGLVSGYFGGVVDLVLQRIVDGIMAFPSLLLLLLLVTVAKPSTISVIAALGFLSTAGISRVLRSAVLSTKQEVYVDAARAMGASHVRVMLQHILPNVTSPIIVMFSIGIGGAMLAEASLSFLGLGTRPPDPSLGRMVSEARALLARYPLQSVFPGLILSLAVLGFNLVGDALRDILDPRMRAR